MWTEWTYLIWNKDKITKAADWPPFIYDLMFRSWRVKHPFRIQKPVTKRSRGAVGTSRHLDSAW